MRSGSAFSTGVRCELVARQKGDIMTRIFVPLALAGLAALADVPLKTKKILVDGVGQVSEGKVAPAREAAVKNAQRAAVEATAGVHIKSMFADESMSQLRANQERFEQSVTSKVYA